MTLKRTYGGWGVDWEHRSKRADLYATIDLRCLNRPQWFAGWTDNTEYQVSLGWGGRGCDPVWSICVAVHLSPWWVQRRERRWERKKAKRG